MTHIPIGEQDAKRIEALLAAKGGKPGVMASKYKNIPTEVDGKRFDSRREADCYLGLKADLDAGKLVSLERQVRYVLQEPFTKDGKRHRALEYVADFVVKCADGRIRVIDAKGMLTDVFRIKQKLFEKRYPDLTIELW